MYIHGLLIFWLYNLSIGSMGFIFDVCIINRT